MSKPAFRVFFNDNKQWVNIYVAKDPASFKRKNQCHAYYIAAETRKQRQGVITSYSIHYTKLYEMIRLRRK